MVSHQRSDPIFFYLESALGQINQPDSYPEILPLGYSQSLKFLSG